jgi:hypothetical protein
MKSLIDAFVKKAVVRLAKMFGWNVAIVGKTSQATTTMSLSQLEVMHVPESLDDLINTRGTTGGLLKRIDENREIMHLVYTKAPGLVASHPWLVGWLDANDEFFTQLAVICPPQSNRRQMIFPRPPTPKPLSQETK